MGTSQGRMNTSISTRLPNLNSVFGGEGMGTSRGLWAWEWHDEHSIRKVQHLAGQSVWNERTAHAAFSWKIPCELFFSVLIHSPSSHIIRKTGVESQHLFFLDLFSSLIFKKQCICASSSYEKKAMIESDKLLKIGRGFKLRTWIWYGTKFIIIITTTNNNWALTLY